MSQSEGKIGSLFYGMTLDTKEFSKKMKKVRKDMGAFGKSMADSFKAIAKGGAIIGGALAIGSAGMLAFAKNTLEATKAQLLLADSIGATQAEIAGLELLTQKWGVETNMVIDKMREFGGLDEFKRLAEEVKNAGDETDQLNKAVELFGGEGAKMLPLLQQGAQGFADMEAEAKKLGLALSPEQIEQSRVAWEEYEGAVMSLKGTLKQIGQAFLEPLGLMSAGLRGFLATFQDNILGGFEGMANTISSFIRKSFNLFAEYGIPFINGFISFAGQIGEAFSVLFNWLSPATDSVLGGFGRMFKTMSDFILTFRESITIGIAKPIEWLIRGTFNLLAKFQAGLADMLGPMITGLAEAGILEDEFAIDWVTALHDQAYALENTGKRLAKPFGEIVKSAEEEMVKKFIDQDIKNEAQIKKFQGFVSKFEMSFAKASSGIEKMAVIPVKVGDAVKSVSDKMSGLILSGSQEEARLKNSGANKMLVVQEKQLKVQEQQLKALDDIGLV